MRPQGDGAFFNNYRRKFVTTTRTHVNTALSEQTRVACSCTDETRTKETRTKEAQQRHGTAQEDHAGEKSSAALSLGCFLNTGNGFLPAAGAAPDTTVTASDAWLFFFSIEFWFLVHSA